MFTECTVCTVATVVTVSSCLSSYENLSSFENLSSLENLSDPLYLWSVTWVSDSVTEWVTTVSKSLSCYSQLKNKMHGRICFILMNDLWDGLLHLFYFDGVSKCPWWNPRSVPDPQAASCQAVHGDDEPDVHLHDCPRQCPLPQDVLPLSPPSSAGHCGRHLGDCLHVLLQCRCWPSLLRERSI